MTCPKCGSENVYVDYIDKILHVGFIFAKEMFLSKINHRKANYYKSTADLSGLASEHRYICFKCGYTWNS